MTIVFVGFHAPDAGFSSFVVVLFAFVAFGCFVVCLLVFGMG